MSLPHTGKVIARVDSTILTFDGNVWAGDDNVVVDFLNRHTPNFQGTHFTVEEAARKVLKRLLSPKMLNLEFEILYAESDTWKNELPPGFID